MDNSLVEPYVEKLTGLLEKYYNDGVRINPYGTSVISWRGTFEIDRSPGNVGICLAVAMSIGGVSYDQNIHEAASNNFPELTEKDVADMEIGFMGVVRSNDTAAYRVGRTVRMRAFDNGWMIE